MKPEETLILYHQTLCGFCWSVREVIDELGIDVELRDIFANREYADELQQARGQGTVPVLRRTDAGGKSEWMPESSDIIQYLIKTYS